MRVSISLISGRAPTNPNVSNIQTFINTIYVYTISIEYIDIIPIRILTMLESLFKCLMFKQGEAHESFYFSYFDGRAPTNPDYEQFFGLTDAGAFKFTGS